MTVAELIEELKKFPPDTLVVGQSETSTWPICPEELYLSYEILDLTFRNVLLLGYRH